MVAPIILQSFLGHDDNNNNMWLGEILHRMFCFFDRRFAHSEQIFKWKRSHRQKESNVNLIANTVTRFYRLANREVFIIAHALEKVANFGSSVGIVGGALGCWYCSWMLSHPLFAVSRGVSRVCVGLRSGVGSHHCCQAKMATFLCRPGKWPLFLRLASYLGKLLICKSRHCCCCWWWWCWWRLGTHCIRVHYPHFRVVPYMLATVLLRLKGSLSMDMLVVLKLWRVVEAGPGSALLACIDIAWWIGSVQWLNGYVYVCM